MVDRIDRRRLRQLCCWVLAEDRGADALVSGYVKFRAGLHFNRAGQAVWSNRKGEQHACRQSIDEIAAELGLSPGAVTSSVRRLLDRAELHGRVGALDVNIGALKERTKIGNPVRVPASVLSKDFIIRDKLLVGRIAASGGARLLETGRMYCLSAADLADDIGARTHVRVIDTQTGATRREASGAFLRRLRRLQESGVVVRKRVGRYWKWSACERAAPQEPTDPTKRAAPQGQELVAVATEADPAAAKRAAGERAAPQGVHVGDKKGRTTRLPTKVTGGPSEQTPSSDPPAITERKVAPSRGVSASALDDIREQILEDYTRFKRFSSERAVIERLRQDHGVSAEQVRQVVAERRAS